MKCNYCGADNKEGAKFCASCGAELKEKKKATKKETTKEEVKSEVKEVKPVQQTTTPAKVTDGKATASLVLGICSLVVWCLTFPLSLIGLILGIASHERSGKRTAGIVINAVGLVLSILCIVISIWFWTVTTAVFEAAVNGENVYKVIEELEKEVEKEQTITPAITNTKTVGDDYYGYVKVPNSWIKFQDLDNSSIFQYTDIGEGGYIITLNTYDENTAPYQAATNVKNHIIEEGNTATVKAAYIGKYFAYKVEAKYTDGTYFDAYLFNADGKLHYVAIEGPDNTNDSFDIPNTFSLTK